MNLWQFNDTWFIYRKVELVVRAMEPTIRGEYVSSEPENRFHTKQKSEYLLFGYEKN